MYSDPEKKETKAAHRLGALALSLDGVHVNNVGDTDSYTRNYSALKRDH